MPERYDGSAFANELLLRNTIVQRMQTGWGVAPPFHFPVTVGGTIRIGRAEQPLGTVEDPIEDVEETSQRTAGELAPDTDVVLTQVEPTLDTMQIKTHETQD